MQDWEREVMEALRNQLEEQKKGIEALLVHLTEAQVHLTKGLLSLGRVGGATTVPQSPRDPEGDWLPTDVPAASVTSIVPSKPTEPPAV